jgi:hypothetical protein
MDGRGRLAASGREYQTRFTLDKLQHVPGVAPRRVLIPDSGQMVLPAAVAVRRGSTAAQRSANTGEW